MSAATRAIWEWLGAPEWGQPAVKRGERYGQDARCWLCGGLDVATDARDFREEAFREGVDMMDYLLMDWLQRQVGRLKGDADGAAQGVLRFPQSQPLVLHVVDHIEDLEIPEAGE